MTPYWGGAGLFGLLVVHAGLWTLQAAWLWDGYDRLRQGAAGLWTDQGAVADGWFRPRLAVRKPVLTVALGIQKVSWSADMAMLTLVPSGVAMSGAIAQQVSLGGAVVASTDGLVVSTTSTPRWSGTNLVFTAAPAVQVASWEVSWDGTVLTVVAPDARTRWLGPSATISGRAVLTGMTPPAWSLQNWVARWGAMTLSGSATLEWGIAGPVLAGTLTITGHGAGLDSLSASHAITSSAAQAMRGVLDTLAAASPPGPVTVPVMLRSGMLTVAGFPLLMKRDVAVSPWP